MFLMAATVFASCKKKEQVEAPIAAPTARADEAAARDELNGAYDDVETVYNSQEYTDASNARIAGVILPCGKVTFNTKNFTIDYGQSGINCGVKVLSGSIDVTLVEGSAFKEQNAKLKVVFNNYKVLYGLSKQSVTYNGTAYVTNKTGGTLVSLFSNTQNVEVIHTVRGDVSITYDTLGTAVIRSWQSFRKKTFKNTSGTSTGITLTLEGDTTLGADTYINGTYNNVSEIGYNLNGEKFVCNANEPFIWQNCGTTYAGPYVLKQDTVQYTAFSSNPRLVAAGYTKYNWTATAGYSYQSPTNVALDQSCTSSAYMVEANLVNPTTGASVYNSTSYIPY